MFKGSYKRVNIPNIYNPKNNFKYISEVISLIGYEQDLKFLKLSNKKDAWDMLYKMEDEKVLELIKSGGFQFVCKNSNVQNWRLAHDYLFLGLDKSELTEKQKAFKLLCSINIELARKFLSCISGVDYKKDFIEYEDFNEEIDNNLEEILITEKTNYSGSGIERDLVVADRTEKEFAYMLYKYFGNLITKIEISSGKFYEWDIKVHFVLDCEITLEIKHDSLSLLTNNTCVEYKNNNSGKSGISASTADFYVYKSFLKRSVSSQVRGVGENRFEWNMIALNKLKRLMLESLYTKRGNEYVGILIPVGGQNGNSRMINIKTIDFLPHCQNVFTMKRNSINISNSLCKYKAYNNPKKYFYDYYGNINSEVFDFLEDCIDFDALEEKEVAKWNECVFLYFKEKYVLF